MDHGVAFPVKNACVPKTAAVLEPGFVLGLELRRGARSRQCHRVQRVTVNSLVFQQSGKSRILRHI